MQALKNSNWKKVELFLNFRNFAIVISLRSPVCKRTNFGTIFDWEHLRLNEIAISNF